MLPVDPEMVQALRTDPTIRLDQNSIIGKGKPNILIRQCSRLTDSVRAEKLNPVILIKSCRNSKQARINLFFTIRRFQSLLTRIHGKYYLQRTQEVRTTIVTRTHTIHHRTLTQVRVEKGRKSSIHPCTRR